MSAPQTPGYGQFTGYAPLPGGQGYAFQLAGGGSVPFVGQAGEELKKRVDATKASYEALGRALPPQQPAAPAQEQAAPAQPSGPQLLFTENDGTQVLLRPGGNPQNPGDFIRRIPGRAGSKGGMAEVARQSQGGYAVDEQFLGQMEESKLRQASAEEQSLQQGIATAAERQSFMRGQQQQMEREAAVQAHENQVKQQRLGELQAKYDQAEQDFVNFHENREKGVAGSKERMANFIGGLAGALGALGASLARTPNFAAEAVARHNEMMMRREEAELRVKKDSRDSLLGRLQQETGSLDLAKNAYRAIQSKQSALAWDALAQKEQDQQRQATMLRASEIHNQEYLKWREAYTRGAEGEVTRSYKFQPGSAGRAAQEVQGLTMEQAGKIANTGATYASTNKTNADAAAAAKADTPKPVAPERTSQIAEDAELLSLGNRILTNPSIAGLDSDTFEARGSLRSKVPLIGPAIAPKEFKQYEQDLQDHVNRRIKFITGAGMAEAEAGRIARGEVGENMSANRVRQGVTKGMGAAATRLKANFATLPPEQQQQLFKQLPPDVQEMLVSGQ